MRKKYVTAFFSFIFMSLFSSQPSFTQSTEELKALRKDLEEIKRGQSNILEKGQKKVTHFFFFAGQ